MSDWTLDFLSPQYALFLAGLLGLYWLKLPLQARLTILLVASLLFYASFQLLFVPLLLALTGLSFWLGQRLPPAADASRGPGQDRQRRWLLIAGISLQVLLLLGCKYVPLGASGSLVLPLGISFFVFESIAYLVDVYQGGPVSRTFLRFATYKLFFAKLISGPITHYQPFALHYRSLQFPSLPRCVDGLWWIACGALKKGVLADHLGPLVDLTYENLERAGSSNLWLAVLAYALQIYLDFSGYTDMARGSALLLGFELPANFDFPYLSLSVGDFWRRWHITLGDWLRQYLYFPLGGSRAGLGRTCANLMLVMLVAGLWHGSGSLRWHSLGQSPVGGFLLWGALHGSALIAHRLTVAASRRFTWLDAGWQTLGGQLAAWGLTQSWVVLAWIPFRLPELNRASLAFGHLWGQPADIQFAQKVYLEAIGLTQAQIWLLLGGLTLAMLLLGVCHRRSQRPLNWPVRAFLVPLCLYAVWLLRPANALRYIYFDF